MRIRVVGVGSPQGDDAAGLAVADRLARDPLPPGVAVSRCRVPALDLLESLGDADALLIVDAMRSGGPPGSVRCLDRRGLPRSSGLSSHALGVAEALALAEALGRCATHVEVFGIEIDPSHPAGAIGLSPAVRTGVDRACALVRERLEALR